MPNKLRKAVQEATTNLKIKAKEVKYLFNGDEISYDSYQRLEKFRSEFRRDEEQYDVSVFDTFELIYRGTNDTRKNVNSVSEQEVKKANVVRNFVSELIESKIDPTIPVSKVLSKKPGMEEQAKMIAEKNDSDMADMPMAKITDINERTVYKHGIAITVMDWDFNLGAHEYIGEKRLLNYHPKQIIPQAGVYDIDLMNRIHFIDPKTKDSILRDYGVDVSNEVQEYPDANEIGDDETSSDNELVSQITRFYIDDEGDVAKFSWVGSTVVEDLPKYYYPRVEYCDKCDRDIPQGSKECISCGNKKLITKILTETVIEEALELNPISYPEKVKTVQNGELVETIETIIKERIVPAGTVISIPVPKFFPIAVRINVPLDFSFRGRSDVELISDLQESHKKILSRVEKKLLDSTAIILLSDKLKSKHLTNAVYDVRYGGPEAIANAHKFDTQSNVSEDLIVLDKLYDYAMRTIGVTPSFQGQYDSSAKSGAAKQIQVNQTNLVLQAPLRNKNNYYARLFKIMFWYDLNFTDEKRSYVSMDNKGNNTYKTFDKNELLCKDAAGKWYYNTDFLFLAQRDDDIPTDKIALYQQIISLFQSGALNVVQLWQELEAVDFPLAKRILEQVKNNESSQILARALEMIKGLPQEQIMAFLQMSTEEQVSAIQQFQGKEATQ